MKHNWFLTVLMILLPCICIPCAYSQNDWENPAVFRVNNEPHHASFTPHLSESTAISDNKNASPFYKSLNGIWNFKWVKNPSEVPADFFAPEFDISDGIELKFLVTGSFRETTIPRFLPILNIRSLPIRQWFQKIIILQGCTAQIYSS